MNELLSKIKISPLFWFVVGIGILTGYFREVLMVFTIVLIHEMGHAIAAHYFNWRIHKIELMPFGGVAEVEDAGNRPFREELIVILAGPLQHLWMILFSYICIGLPFWSTTDHQLFLWHNVMILGFNMIPVLPLDGGRLIQLWFTYRFSYVQALNYSRWMSAFILSVLLIISTQMFPFHLNLWIVLSFLIVTNYLEWKQRHYRFIRFLLARRSSKNIRLQQSVLVVRDSMPLREVMKKCRRGHRHRFKIFQSLEGSSLTVNEEELIDVLFAEKQPQAPLSTFVFSGIKQP